MWSHLSLRNLSIVNLNLPGDEVSNLGSRHFKAGERGTEQTPYAYVPAVVAERKLSQSP